MTDLQDANVVLTEVVDRLAETYRPEKIILFGSLAYGTPNRESDIDLLIVKDSQETPYRRAVEVRRLLRDPKRFTPIDFIVVTPGELQERLRRGDQFLKTVLSKGKLIYGT